MSLNTRSDRGGDASPKPLLNIGNVGKGIAAVAVVTLLGYAGWKRATENGPGPRPEYTAGSADVNKKVNDKLIPQVERECLTQGSLDEVKFRRERRDILGDQEENVRVLCQRVADMTDKVFTLEIEGSARKTRDGKVYIPTHRIVAPQRYYTKTGKNMSSVE